MVRNSIRSLKVAVTVLSATLLLSSCSWFNKPNESIREAVSQLPSDQLTISESVDGHPELDTEENDEVANIIYENGNNAFEMISVRLDTVEDASRLFGEIADSSDSYFDAKGNIRKVSTVTNMNVMGGITEGANITGKIIYLDNEYILYFDINLEDADESITSYIGSIFDKIGLDNPISAPKDIIV